MTDNLPRRRPERFQPTFAPQVVEPVPQAVIRPLRNERDLYWIVGDDETRLWSNASDSYVLPDNPAYLAWLEIWQRPLRTPDEETLSTWLEIKGQIGPTIRRNSVNAERDRRIFSGVTFMGVRFQNHLEDQKRINGACTMALAAMMRGAQPGDYRWHGGEEDFGWIAEDNSVVPMDAQTVFAFGQAVAHWESANVFAASAIKKMQPIPADFADDKYWP